MPFNLDRFHTLTQNDPLIGQELAILFYDTIQRNSTLLLTESSDHRMIQQALHEIIGAAENLGFSEFASVCREHRSEALLSISARVQLAEQLRRLMFDLLHFLGVDVNNL
jgi:hypothetical protein